MSSTWPALPRVFIVLFALITQCHVSVPCVVLGTVPLNYLLHHGPGELPFHSNVYKLYRRMEIKTTWLDLTLKIINPIFFIPVCAFFLTRSLKKFTLRHLFTTHDLTWMPKCIHILMILSLKEGFSPVRLFIPGNENCAGGLEAHPLDTMIYCSVFISLEKNKFHPILAPQGKKSLLCLKWWIVSLRVKHLLYSLFSFLLLSIYTYSMSEILKSIKL